MVPGDVATLDTTALPEGWVVTSSGRISGVTQPGDVSLHYPFPIKDLVALDDALTYGSRASKARFAVYIGDLGSDTAARAREILAKVPTPNDAVLLAVSPNQRAIEVVYGAGVRGRGAESVAPVAVAAAASAFQQGNLIDGLISAIRVMSAGISPGPPH
ncbi:DUF5130 domain-containing protein [Mycobacterium botniense]|uniref:DUF5130 domain-containing protein n=1 Tax=Mycobacterium botniense TaxID=84962 RepID=A0A7I9Y010_9MYCO|nr:DUF5130 domain-containing protein [Mycobacterium botniense]GFG75293.1 DUF5130 domain-containing protein [Mycobacterium botniense]